MKESNKYDVTIKSGTKDYVKLKLVINSIKFLIMYLKNKKLIYKNFLIVNYKNI